MLDDKYIKILKSLEGFRSHPYKCSAGVTTIGYGHSEHMDNIALNTTSITEKQATDLLKKDVAQFEHIVKSNVKVPLTDNQLAALTFFAFNIGENAFKRSTLLKKLNSGDYDSVPSQMLRWIKIGDSPSVGLSARRHKEISIWLDNKKIEESNYMLPKPHTDMGLPHKEFIANCSTSIIGLLADTTGNDILQWTFAILIIVFFGYYFIKYRNKLVNLW